MPGFSAHPDDWAIPVQQHLLREMARHAEVRVITTRYPPSRPGAPLSIQPNLPADDFRVYFRNVRPVPLQ
jgi:hypothetical protein